MASESHCCLTPSNQWGQFTCLLSQSGAGRKQLVICHTRHSPRFLQLPLVVNLSTLHLFTGNDAVTITGHFRLYNKTRAFQKLIGGFNLSKPLSGLRAVPCFFLEDNFCARSDDDALGWKLVLKISHLPSKLRLLANCSFFGQSFILGTYSRIYQPREGGYLLNNSICQIVPLLTELRPRNNLYQCFVFAFF